MLEINMDFGFKILNLIGFLVAESGTWGIGYCGV